MFYGPYKCKNKNEIQHFINMAILNEDGISNLSELMGVIKVDCMVGKLRIRSKRCVRASCWICLGLF